jgi:hypothetical protein
MRIERIYVNTYRKDFHLARVCVASIRYWYPDIPIFLIKDIRGAGDFDTSTLERRFHVAILEAGARTMGWGFGKLQPLLRPPGEAFMIMDADTVMSGPLLDRLAYIEADVIVDDEVQPREKLLTLYYDTEKLGILDPGFTYPGYSFNTGQYAAVSGILKESDLEPFLDWGPPPGVLRPDIFKNGEQGLLNYIMQKKQAEGSIRLSRTPVMIWPEDDAANHVDLHAIRERRPVEDRVIHWAGMKGVPEQALPRTDIIHFFRDEYFRHAGPGQRYIDFMKDSYGYARDLAVRVRMRVGKAIRV